MSQKKTLYSILEDTVDAHHMLDGVGGVLVGFSGGADSSALLRTMHSLCQEKGIYLHALHVHHGIRGDEADRDAEFCRQECERMGVDFTLERADIPALAKQSGQGIEQTAREFRYQAFERCVLNDSRLNCIATAHNADDNAETVLFNLTRGSGSAGLCGIPPVRYQNAVRVIRPLLYVTKKEITDYCEKNGIQYIFDSTNDDRQYTRNYIRHEVMPLLERINPAFLDSVGRMTEHLTSEREYLDECVMRFVENESLGGGIPVCALNGAHRAVAARAVMLMFSKVSEETLEGVHVDAVLELARKGHEYSSLSLCGGVKAFVEDGTLFFGEPRKPEAIEFCRELSEGVNLFKDLGFALLVAPEGEISEDLQKDNETLKNIYKLSIHTSLNSDKINHVLSARSRRDGDSYVFGGMTRKLKKLYNDRAVPHRVRAVTPVICDREGIVWVPGFKAADRVRTCGKGTQIIYYCNEIVEDQYDK